MNIYTLDDLNIACSKEVTKLNRGDPHLLWTGWKPVCISRINQEQSYPPEGTLSMGMVSQWVNYHERPGGKYFYVNLPGMEHGLFGKNEEFDIGLSRIYISDDWNKVEAAIKNGFGLMAVETFPVDNDGRKIYPTADLVR